MALVLHYPFAETSGTSISDASGNGNTGTILTGTWAAGHDGNGLAGTANCGNGSSINALGPLTVAMWIKPAALTGCLAYKSDNDGSAGWFFGLDNAQGLKITVVRSSIDAYIRAPYGFSVDTWHHVAATWDGNATTPGLQLYCDGQPLTVESSSTGNGTHTTDAAYALELGTYRQGTSGAFNGTYDDVRLYNTVLSQQEINALYTGGADSLSPAAMAAAASMQSAALTQTHILQTSGMGVAASMSTSELVYGDSLSSAAMAVAASMQSAALTQTHTLVPPGVTASASMPDAALAQTHLLMSANMAVAPRIPSAVLFPVLPPDVLMSRLNSLVQRYRCTLTGCSDGADDIRLPVSSFSARLRADTPSYLSIVVPTTEYAADVAARPHGSLTLTMAYLAPASGVIVHEETLLSASIDEVRVDEGGCSRSVTLTGYAPAASIPTLRAPAALTGIRSTYRSVTSGRRRFRCAARLVLLPGDTVTVDNERITVAEAVYTVTGTARTLELVEA